MYLIKKHKTFIHFFILIVLTFSNCRNKNSSNQKIDDINNVSNKIIYSSLIEETDFLEENEKTEEITLIKGIGYCKLNGNKKLLKFNKFIQKSNNEISIEDFVNNINKKIDNYKNNFTEKNTVTGNIAFLILVSDYIKKLSSLREIEWKDYNLGDEDGNIYYNKNEITKKLSEKGINIKWNKVHDYGDISLVDYLYLEKKIGKNNITQEQISLLNLYKQEQRLNLTLNNLEKCKILIDMLLNYEKFYIKYHNTFCWLKLDDFYIFYFNILINGDTENFEIPNKLTEVSPKILELYSQAIKKNPDKLVSNLLNHIIKKINHQDLKDKKNKSLLEIKKYFCN